MRRAIPAWLFALLIAAPTARAASPGTPATAEPAPSAAVAHPVTPDEGPAPSGRPAYGPIRAKDPAVRAEIKGLYVEMERVDDDAHAAVAALAEQIRAEPDPVVRLDLQRAVAKAKEAAQLRRMEIGLEIARLNGDESRVAEFELALDQLRHPEKYRPAPADPAIERARLERGPQ